MKYYLIISGIFTCSLFLTAQEHSITVNDYKQKVLEYSRQIKQYAEERTAMQYAVKVAKTAFLPSIDFSGNYQYRINSSQLDFGPAFSAEIDHNTYNIGVSLNQSIYTGGQIYNQYKATQIQSQIAMETEELTTDNVLYAADITYWSAAARKGMYEVMKQYVQIVQALADVLETRFEEGQISKTDLLQVQARLKEAELNQSTAYKDFQIALQNLNVLMGLSPMNSVELTDAISKVLPLPQYIDEEIALRNRPELKIKELNTEYLNRQIRLVKAKYSPSLAIGFQTTWGTPLLNVKGSEQLWTPAIVASLKIPLFHGGARFKEVNKQKALLRNSEYAQDETRDQITQELANAWTNLTEYTKQIEVAKRACEIAEENLDLNTFSYNEGKLPILDVLSAQLSWIQSFSNLIQTWYQQKIAIAQYNKAVGLRQL